MLPEEKEMIDLKEMFLQLMGNRIAQEYNNFGCSMISFGAEEVFANAYKIDICINLYEILLEMAESFSVSQLYRMMLIPNLLDYLYSRWLKVNDSQQHELREFLENIAAEK